MRKSFVFYESFYLALGELSASQQGKIYTAICRYALYGEEPELKGASAAVFKLIKPQIDANNRRYENGKLGGEHGVKGGRPKKPQRNPKETPKKPQANPKQTPNDNVNVNVNVNDNVNANVTDNDNGTGVNRSGGFDDDDFFNLWKRMSPADVDKIYDVYPDTGGDLIQTVYEEVRDKRRDVEDPVPYILGYAKNVGWEESNGS